MTNEKTDIEALAKQLHVPLHAACKRAGINPSTPWRWRKGATPTQYSWDRLNAAIVLIAHERGTLPDELAFMLDLSHKLIDAGTDQHATVIIRGIKQRLNQLERAIA